MVHIQSGSGGQCAQAASPAPLCGLWVFAALPPDVTGGVTERYPPGIPTSTQVRTLAKPVRVR